MFSRFTKYYIREKTLTKEIKMELLKVFKRKVSNKNIKLNSYLKTTEYERSINAYHTNNKKELEELRNLKVGLENFEEKLSSKLTNLINEYYYKKYYIEINFQSANKDKMSFEEEKYILRKINELQKGKMKHDFETSIDDINLDSIFSSEKVIYEEDIISKVVEYAISENKMELIEVDSNGKVRLSNESIDRFIINKEPVPLTTKVKAKKSINRSYQTIDNLAKANAQSFKYFVTLTFADITEQEKHLELNNKRKENEYDLKFKYVEDSKSIECCSKILHKFLTNLNWQITNIYKLPKIKYLGVPEYQKNGNIHYHFLISELPMELFYQVPGWLDKKFGILRNGIGVKSWFWGKSDVEEIKDKARITSYIEKYLTKDLKEISDSIYKERLNKKRFYKSNNLIKPQISYNEIIDTKDSISIYQTVKTNSFNDSLIVNKVIQLKEIN